MAITANGVDIDKVLELHAKLDHIKYGLGSKAYPKYDPPEKIRALDCSGYVYYVLHVASGGKVRWTGGTSWQRDHCKKDRTLTNVAYDQANAGAPDNKLRVAFKPKG